MRGRSSRWGGPATSGHLADPKISTRLVDVEFLQHLFILFDEWSANGRPVRQVVRSVYLILEAQHHVQSNQNLAHLDADPWCEWRRSDPNRRGGCVSATGIGDGDSGDDFVGNGRDSHGTAAATARQQNERRIGIAESALGDLDTHDESVHHLSDSGRLARRKWGRVDGVLSGSRVWWDANLNGRYDVGEPSGITSRDGGAILEVPLSVNDRNGNGFLDGIDGRLMLTGGIDVATGMPFTGRLAAPVDAAVISPLTTLLDTLVRKTSRNESDIQGEIRAVFQLPADLDIHLFDPWKPGMEASTHALSVHAANAVLADTSSLLGQFFAAANPTLGSSPSQITDAIESAWAELVLQKPEGLPGARSWVQGVMGRTASALGTSIDSARADSISRVMGSQNESKRKAIMGGDLISLLGMQTTSLEETAQALKWVAAAQWNGEDLLLANQGWEGRARQLLTSVDPYATNASPGEFTLSANVAVVREGGVPVQGLSVVRSGGSVGSATITLTLTDSVGRLKTNRMALEFQDGERQKTVDWMQVLVDDSQAATHRTLSVALTSAVSSPAGAVIGSLRTATVSVLDDETAGAVSFVGPTHTYDLASSSSSGPEIVRTGGVSGRLLVRVEYSSGNTAAAGPLPEPVTLEFLPGVSRRIVPMPALTASANGMQPVVVLKMSLAAGSAQGAVVGGTSETRVEYRSAPISTVPVQIRKFESLSANAFRLSVSGPPGGKHVVETSADLITWKTLTTANTVVTQGEPVVTVDVPADAASMRNFFRLRTLVGQ